MPEPDADPQNYDGGQGQRFGRGGYGLGNYQARYGRGYGLNQRLGRGLYSSSLGYYSPYSYYYPYYSSYLNNNPGYYYPYFGYPGFGQYGQGYGQGFGNRYGINRNRGGFGQDNYGGGGMGGGGMGGGGMGGGMGGGGRNGGDSGDSSEQ